MRRALVVSWFSLLVVAACGSSGSDDDSSSGGEAGASDATGGSGGRGGSGDDVNCTPGSTQECVGPGACRGGQRCLADGSGWDVCNCQGTAGGNAGTGAVGGAGGAGGSAGKGTSGSAGSASGASGMPGSGGSSAGGSSGGSAGSGVGGSSGTGGTSTTSDSGEVHWILNGSQVASGQLGAHTGTNMSFAAVSVTAYLAAGTGTGTFGCDVFPAMNIRITMSTADGTGVDLSRIPAAWKNLSFTECRGYMIADETGTVVTVTRWDTRAVGTFDMTIVGADERAGDTMVLSGSFNVGIVE